MLKYEKKIFHNAEAKNCVSSSKYKPPRRGGWIELWEEITGRSSRSGSSRCAFYGCGNEAEVGGFVLIKRRTNKYIVAICYRCNNSRPVYEDLKFNTACVEIISEQFSDSEDLESQSRSKSKMKKRCKSSSESSSSTSSEGSSSDSNSDSDSESRKKSSQKKKRKKNKHRNKKSHKKSRK